MAVNDIEKPSGPAKSFMTIGPTLHYSHANVHTCWFTAVGVYVAACLFWSKILTGTALDVRFDAILDRTAWQLGHFVLNPLSIYEYPWQIFCLGLLMGIIAVSPVLVSQLLSFRYSVPMILAAAFIARLPLFGVFLAVSCIAVACRPLRFRSRIIAIVLCMAPQLVYCALFGGTPSADPIRLGFSFAPWICAWLMGIGIAGIVMVAGHYTRYKPGLIWTVIAAFLAIVFGVFNSKISFGELDYQLYVAKNNPEEVREFRNHNMTGIIDNAMRDPGTKSYLGPFYPTEPILLREYLKNEIQIQLGYDRWPYWFKVPDDLKYQAKKQWLLKQYDIFITKRPTSKRMPVALYYKARLNEYTPDIRFFSLTENLRFYSDYPHSETRPIWYKLFDQFPQSPEAIEARWRIAMHLAGQGAFDKATELCEVAIAMIDRYLQEQQETQSATGMFPAVFTTPAKTAMTPVRLKDVRQKLRELILLISRENKDESQASGKRLSRFVLLNPYKRDYQERLDNLLSETATNDLLRDNILLAKTMLIPDTQLKTEELKKLSETYANTDGGMHAMLELGLLEVRLWKEEQTRDEMKKQHLAQARAVLTGFISVYPKSIFTEQAQTILDSLPSAE